ncbi:MAG: FAD-dependent oxidoreductase [Puia sp.]|nr:FAD-dependent oxidoreductase [Puia sp.]
MADLSVWEKESYFAPRDIVIAGSGLVGLWSAYFLKKRHPALSIAILERGIIPSGASTRNAGFACFGSATELIADTMNLGEDPMLELVEMRYKGLKKIRKIFGAKTIAYEKQGGYELIAEEQGTDMDILRGNIDRLNRKLKKITGHAKIFRLHDDKIKEFGFAGIRHLIENPLEGQLHSGQLSLALLKEVQSMGVLVLNNISIDHFEKVADGILLQTTPSAAPSAPVPSGPPPRDQRPTQTIPLFAHQLLVCTNAFARQLLPDLDIRPARGQVLLTSPISNLPFKGAFHFDEGYYYFRNLGDRVLLGGARNKDFEAEQTFEPVTTDTIQQELERFLQETILPGQTYAIEQRWSGIMGMGTEKMPIIKAVDDNLFCAVRMSGMGVALAPVTAEKVAALMR